MIYVRQTARAVKTLGILIGVLFLSTAYALAQTAAPVSTAPAAPPVVMSGVPPLPIVNKSPNPNWNVFQGYAKGGCGAYFGINAMGAGGSTTGATSTNALSGGGGVTLGYGCPFSGGAGNFWFIESNFDFQNINGNGNGLSIGTGGTPAHFEQRFGLGSPINALLGTISNPFGSLSVPQLAPLPAGITAGPSYPFIFASIHEQDVSASYLGANGRDWIVSPGVGIGLQSRLSNGVVSEVAAQWVLQSQSVAIGANTVKFGNAAMVSAALKY
jgi:hypothetical protein